MPANGSQICDWCPGQGPFSEHSLRLHQSLPKCRKRRALVSAQYTSPSAPEPPSADDTAHFYDGNDDLPDTGADAWEEPQQLDQQQPSQQQQQELQPELQLADGLALNPLTRQYEQALTPAVVAAEPLPGLPDDTGCEDNSIGSLPEEYRLLRDALADLPTASKDAVLRILARPNFNPQNVPWRNAQEFNQYLDINAAQDWKPAHVSIVVKGSEYTFPFSYRASLEPLAELVRSRKAGRLAWDGNHCFSEAGDRVWSSFHNADWLRRNQERLKGYVCPWIGYNDGTILERDGDRKAHPVVIFCPLQPLSHMLSRDGYRRVALLPSVDASSFSGSNLDDKRDNILLSDLQRRLDAACIRIFLADWKEASFSGTIFKDADGIERRCYPLLAFWIADRKAANALLNIKHHPAYYSDPWDLVHKDSLDQYDRTFEPRTAAAMKQVVKAAKALLAKGEEKEALQKLDSVSLHEAEMTCLYGFNTDVDCHHLVFPDAMHNTSCGLIKHLFDVTEKKLHASGQYNIVKERFKQVPSYMDLHLPAKRLVAKNITATQRHSLGACMPVCLLGLEDMEPYCHAFTALMEWSDLRDMRQHTEHTIAAVQDARVRFQSAAVGLGDKSWAFPKFYDMFKFGELIREFGSVAIASASYGERSHKDFKAAKLFTNNHKATLMNQISKQVRRLDGVRQAQEDMYEAPGHRAMSVAQKALKSGLPHMTIRGGDVDYRAFHQDSLNRLGSLSDTERELLQQQPELQQLYKAVCLMLAGYPTRNPQDPEATLLARLPKLSYPKVKVSSALGVAYERRVGDDMVGATLRASPSFGSPGHPVFDDVAVRGNADQTWFAQLRLLFSYRSNHSGKMIAAAFVRWYDAADTRNRLPSKGRLLKGRQDRPLRGMQRLKWATLKEGRTELPHYDCILADRIFRPVYIQPDPTCPQRFHFNHYVK